MKILITILGFLNGGYMLLDGIYVMLKRKYIGPEKPGPWAELFISLILMFLNLDRYLSCLDCYGSPGFIVSGLISAGHISLGILISSLSFWYLPIGQFFH
jgi:hypothetical protein